MQASKSSSGTSHMPPRSKWWSRPAAANAGRLSCLRPAPAAKLRAERWRISRSAILGDEGFRKDRPTVRSARRRMAYLIVRCNSRACVPYRQARQGRVRSDRQLLPKPLRSSPPRNRGARQSLRPRERGGHSGRLRRHVASIVVWRLARRPDADTWARFGSRPAKWVLPPSPPATAASRP